jgi:hypothetical protein
MTAKHIVLRAVYVMGLMAGMSLTWVVNVSGPAIHPPIGTPLPDPPQVFRHSSFGLSTTRQQVRGYVARRARPLIRSSFYPWTKQLEIEVPPPPAVIDFGPFC